MEGEIRAGQLGKATMVLGLETTVERCCVVMGVIIIIIWVTFQHRPLIGETINSSENDVINTGHRSWAFKMCAGHQWCTVFAL